MQLMLLYIISSCRFEETFVNTHWRKVKQMLTMQLWIILSNSLNMHLKTHSGWWQIDADGDGEVQDGADGGVQRFGAGCPYLENIAVPLFVNRGTAMLSTLTPHLRFCPQKQVYGFGDIIAPLWTDSIKKIVDTLPNSFPPSTEVEFIIYLFC